MAFRLKTVVALLPWRGSYESEGRILRQVSADIHEHEVNIALILALLYDHGCKVLLYAPKSAFSR